MKFYVREVRAYLDDIYRRMSSWRYCFLILDQEDYEIIKDFIEISEKAQADCKKLFLP